MINNLIKATIGIVGLGSITTASYFIRDYCNTERITHRISDTGKTLLSWSDKNEEWLKRWKEYVKHNSGKDIWNLNNYEKDKLDQSKVPNSFKNKCLYSTSTALEGNEKLATEIEKYCTKSFKLADLINKEKGIKLIAKEDRASWESMWKNYLKTKNEKGRNELDITKSVFADTLPQEYINKCHEKSNKEIRSPRDTVYSVFRNWCTKAK